MTQVRDIEDLNRNCGRSTAYTGHHDCLDAQTGAESKMILCQGEAQGSVFMNTEDNMNLELAQRDTVAFQSFGAFGNTVI